MTRPARLQVVIPFHEPLSRDEEYLDRVWEESYAPLLERLAERGIKAAVHLTGHLLDHLARRREDFLLDVKRHVQGKKLEVLGGLFYGAIPGLVPEVDTRGQVQMMSEYWESLIGAAPTGFWLPELAWCPEVPRLIADTGLAFGFVSSSQLALRPDPLPDLVTLERAEQAIAAFVLESELSTALTLGQVAELEPRLALRPDSVVSVWLAAGRLLDTERAHPGMLDAILGGLADAETVLPANTFAEGLRSRPARLAPGIAPELWPAEPRPDFADLALRSPGVDDLVRRMLRASNKLADAISTMEDDELEDAWSDTLATAQRMVFAAQAPDGYVQGEVVEGEVARAAAVARLIRAEALMDALVQGEEDWIATEEEDADADLRDEVFVCNRHLTAWVVPADGGAVRSLDDRIGELTLLDPARGGIAERVYDPGVRAGEVLGDTAPSLLPAGARWSPGDSRIDESGDLAYHLGLALESQLGDGRTLRVRKELAVPMDAAEARLSYTASVEGGPAALLATEIPLRLPTAPTAILANGDPLEPGALELTDVESIRLETARGALEVSFEPAAEVWCKLGDERCVVVPILRLEGEAQSSVRVTWQSAAAARGGQLALEPEGDEVVAEEEEALAEEEEEGGEPASGGETGDSDIDEGQEPSGDEEPTR